MEMDVMGFRRWIQNKPRLLEAAYGSTKQIILALDPVIKRIGYERVDRWIRPAEDLSKQLIFDCKMCGQCILHSTGMTCSMTCPKNLRNGPCGGVRIDGHCEVIPEMKCIWVDAYERSEMMGTYGQEIMLIQPPINWELEGQSAWINMLTGADVELPAGWEKGEVTA